MPENTTNVYTLDDMLGNPPGWLLKSGISLVFITTFGLLFMTWFIQYPDKLTGQAIIQTEFPPVEMFPPTSGIIDSILISQNEGVEKNQALLLIESSAKWEDVEKVKQYLNDPFLMEGPLSLQLGPVQNAFAAWQSEWNRNVQAEKNPETAQKIQAFQQEKVHLQGLNNSITRRIAFYEKELQLIQKDLDRSKKLREVGAISEVELEQKTNVELQAQRQREQLLSEKVQNRVRGEQLTNQIIEAKQARTQLLDEQNIRLEAVHQQLKSAIEDWEQRYLVRATTKGRVELSQNLSQGQMMTTNDRLLVISPDQVNTEIVARCIIPVQGAGKIALGQTVQLELPAYPTEEYGALTGKVISLAEIPILDGEKQLQYNVTVSLDYPFITNYGKEIPFQQNSTAQARIITKKRRLLQRFLDQILTKIQDVE